jgi:hypothetical protein
VIKAKVGLLELAKQPGIKAALSVAEHCDPHTPCRSLPSCDQPRCAGYRVAQLHQSPDDDPSQHSKQAQPTPSSRRQTNRHSQKRL